jgi:hypothetical protein
MVRGWKAAGKRCSVVILKSLHDVYSSSGPSAGGSSVLRFEQLSRLKIQHLAIIHVPSKSPHRTASSFPPEGQHPLHRDAEAGTKHPRGALSLQSCDPRVCAGRYSGPDDTFNIHHILPIDNNSARYNNTV